MTGFRQFKAWAIGAAVLMAISLTLPAAFGQAITGSMSGTVLDPNGAVIAGATVTITAIETNITHTVTTDASGIFIFTTLKPGTYKVKIEKEGFAPLEIPSVQVLLGRDSALKPTLQVGQAGGEVTVVGTEAVLIEKNTVQVTNNWEARKVTDLPIGNFFGGIDSLALLAPGVVPGFGNVNGNGSTLSVNGQRARSNNFTIDGQDNNDNSIGGPGFFLDNEDTVQEFQIVTNNFSAEYGRNAGAVVNIITRTGTNAYHGNLTFNYLDAHSLNALSPKEKASGRTSPDKFLDRRYDITLGGPIVKDKAFFFFAFQGEDQVADAFVNGSTSSRVITPAGIATLRQFNPTNQLLTLIETKGPLARNVGSLELANTFKQNFGSGANLVKDVEVGVINRSVPLPFDQFEFTSKIDFSVTPRDQISWRYLFQDGEFTNGTGRFLAGYTGDVPFRSQNIGLTWTHQLWTRSVNELRSSYGRLAVAFGGGSITSTGDVFGPKAVTNVNLPAGFLDFGIQSNLPQSRIVNTYQFVDNFSTQWRDHTMKAGIDVRRQHTNNFFLPNLIGTFNFANTTQIVQNTPGSLSFTQGDATLNLRETDQFYYFQDDWRYKPNLTLNLGLRYEHTGQPINRLREIQLAREANPAQALFRQSIPLEQRVLPKINNDNNNWAPRIGFAWSPRLEGFGSMMGKFLGQDKTVIRGGYSIAYDPAFFNILLNISTVAPHVLAFNQISGQFVPASGSPQDVVKQVNAPRNALDPSLLTQTRVPKAFRAPYAENWSIGIQREIARDQVIEVRYVGTRGIGLFQSVNGNPLVSGFFSAGLSQFLPPGAKPVPVSGNLPGTPDNEAADDGRLIKGQGLLRVRQNSANSIYHGLQTRYQARWFKQLDFSLSYTWSHTIDNVSEIFGFFDSGSPAFAQTPFNLGKAERGTSNFNRTQSLALSWIWDIDPFHYVSKKKGILAGFAKGWQFNGTAFFANGQPWQPVQFAGSVQGSDLAAATDDFNFNNAFVGLFTTFRPFISNSKAPIGSVGEFKADGTFVNSATGKVVSPDSVRFILNNRFSQAKFGNIFGAGRGLFTGSAINRWNLGLFKNTRLRERANLQIRVELVNAFNHPNFGNPDIFADDAGSTFANTSANDATARQVRLGAKLIF